MSKARWKFDKVNKILFKGKRKIKKSDLDSFAKFAVWSMENGDSVNNIFAEETDDCPRLAEILYHVDEHYGEAAAKASGSQIAILQGDLLQAAKDYRGSNRKDDLEKVVALEKIYTSLAKQNEKSRPFNILFNQIYPNDFWSGHENPLPPENPRTDSELDSAFAPREI